MFRVLENPKHVACFPPLFFFFSLELKKFLLRFETQKRNHLPQMVCSTCEKKLKRVIAGPVGARESPLPIQTEEEEEEVHAKKVKDTKLPNTNLRMQFCPQKSALRL